MLDTNPWKAAVALHQIKEPQMTTSSRKEAQQSLLSFLAAVPAAALVVWATFSLTHFVV